MPCGREIHKPNPRRRIPGLRFVCGLRFPSYVANIVYFDLETQKIASEVGGWGHIDKMGLAVAVLYHTDRSAYDVYLEKDADRLITDLRRADLVVGFNVIRFDYAVLSAYSVFDFSTVPTLDLMVSLEEKIGHRVGLDAVADATCGVKKTASGIEAIQWWREGKQSDCAGRKVVGTWQRRTPLNGRN
ncbi:MAG: helicase [Verrucomicrobia bacterium]|nr:helicase [Verrucomicrobiota bacterium]